MIADYGKRAERIVAFSESEARAIVDEIKDVAGGANPDAGKAIETLRRIAGDFQDGLDRLDSHKRVLAPPKGMRLWKVTEERYAERTAIFAAKTAEDAIRFYEGSHGGWVHSLEISGGRSIEDLVCEPFDPGANPGVLYEGMDPLPVGVNNVPAAVYINTEEDMDEDGD